MEGMVVETRKRIERKKEKRETEEEGLLAGKVNMGGEEGKYVGE